jgi:phage gp29-like protein
MANKFFDLLGKVLPLKALTEDVATARVGSVRDWMSGHPADGMTPQRLAAIHRAAANGDPESFFELAEDIEERDLHYAGVLGTRKRSVAQLPITVKAASDSADHKKHAELIQAWIDDEVLRAALFDMLDAIGKGVSVMEIEWKMNSRGQMVPRELIWRTQRWFTLDDADGETLLLREAVGNQPLPPHKFIVHRHKSKSGLTIRSGIARVASWAWMFKAFTVKDWAIFVQNYGQPIRIGKYGRGATEAEKDVLWRAVSQIAGDCAAIVPNGMLIEFHEVKSSSSSSDAFEKRANWLDQQMSKAVLGQTTTTDAISGGHAVSQEHRLVQEDIERSDAMCLSSTINEQLVPFIVAINFGPQDHYPKVRIGRPDEVPLGEFSDAFAKLAPLGLTAPMSYIRDRMSIPEPDKDAELVGGRSAAPVPAGDLTARQSLDRLFSSPRSSRHAIAADADPVAILADRLERDAARVMDGLLDDVRAVLEEATDLRDAATRLAKLELDPDALAEAMARGMALAHLAGQASLIEDLDR